MVGIPHDCPACLQPTILPEPSPAPAPAPPPAPAPVADTANTEEAQKLTQKVSKLQDELSLAEREKLKVQQVCAYMQLCLSVNGALYLVALPVRS